MLWTNAWIRAADVVMSAPGGIVCEGHTLRQNLLIWLLAWSGFCQHLAGAVNLL